MSVLFSEFRLREVSFRNRIFVSPMCQYSSRDGLANDWHLVHLGSRAVGGAALVMVEATAVSPEGRISPADMGLWSEDHVDGLRRITRFIREHGSVAGIQLAHAGRKASTAPPWEGGKTLTSSQGGWETFAPSAVPFDSTYSMPRELTLDQMIQVREDFKEAARRSHAAGFQVIEIHVAHGYLLHEFLSPLSNLRKDTCGGSLENRMRFPLEVISETRKIWPENLPLFVRISATDWAEGGWDLLQSIEFSKKLKKIGVDLVDCSSGGLVPTAKIPAGPGYQVPFAEEIRKEVQIPTGAVGLITGVHQAEEIVSSGKADVVFLAREFLRRPYWPLYSAHALGLKVHWPQQYERGRHLD